MKRFEHILERDGVLGALLMVPAVLYIVLLVAVPFGLAITYSFSDAIIGRQEFNYVGMETLDRTWEDPIFQKSLRNTFRFTLISQVVVTTLSLVLALILTEHFPGKWLFRFLILLPWTTPIALGTIGWLWMLHSVYSPIDYVLRELELLGPGTRWGPRRNMYWLALPDRAVGSVIAVHIWRMLPLSTVIIMAGLSSIPEDIEDAAAVDGAGFFRKLFEVKLPLIVPITAVATLFGLIFTFTDMTVVHVLVRGGPPEHTTQVLASWAFYKGIEGTDLAGGAATALFMFPVLLAVAIAVLRFVRRAEVR